MDNLLKYVSQAIGTHSNFLNATDTNLNYLYFGKSVGLSLPTRNNLGQVTHGLYDTGAGVLIDALASTKTNPFSPLYSLIRPLFQEMYKSSIHVRVDPLPPIKNKEGSYEFARTLEIYLKNLFETLPIKLATGIPELMARGYFGLYSDAKNVWVVKAENLIPGNQGISNLIDQPFIIRRTYPRKSSLLSALPTKGDERVNQGGIEELDTLQMFDTVQVKEIWSRDLSLRKLVLPSDSTIFSETVSPFVYPIFLLKDGFEAGQFYPMPILTRIRPSLDKLTVVSAAISDSVNKQAKPLLVYDEESGIDPDKLKAQLETGQKNIIIGKTTLGDINYKRPGALPNYVFSYKADMLKDISDALGFYTPPLAGKVRERGALEAMLRATMSEWRYVSALVEHTLTNLADYVLNYMQNNYFDFVDKLGIHYPSSLVFKKSKFKAHVKLVSPGSFTLAGDQSAVLRKYTMKLISRRQALEELGYPDPNKIVDEIKDEISSDVGLAEKLKRPQVSVVNKVKLALDTLDYKPIVKELAPEKILVKVKMEDIDEAKFILSEFGNKVMIKGVISKKVKFEKEEEEEKSVSEPSVSPTPPPSVSVPPSVTPKSETKIPVSSPPAVAEPSSSAKSSKKKIFPISYLKKLALKTREIVKKEEIEGYISRYPGLYLVEPHAVSIYKGKKLLIIKSRLFDIVDSPHILIGENAYGLLIPRKVIQISLKTFDNLRKYHLISEEERKKWWPDRKKLFAYLFEFYKFGQPMTYKRKEGVQTFQKEVLSKKETEGVPVTGDLKPYLIKPWKVPPPHKPEKKALKPYELFDFKRLAQAIPNATYNISWKGDGVYGYCWKVGDEIRFYSDQGNRFADERVKSLYLPIKLLFKGQDVLLAGEIMLKEKIHQDVAGFVHKHGKPTSEEEKGLFFAMWDILYLSGKSLAEKAFIDRWRILNLKLKSDAWYKGKIYRVRNSNLKRNSLPKAYKKYRSHEGAFIRDVDAAYWSTHTSYKTKELAEIDVKVIGVEKTKVGLPIFKCVLADGTYIGKTYAQAEVKAKKGDVIRVQVDHVSLRLDGSIGWFAPRPAKVKGRITDKRPSLKQEGIGRPDTLSFVKELYLAKGGTEKKWEIWYPKYLIWKKTKMSKI